MKLRKKSGPDFTIPKINSEWVLELNVKTIKLVRDNIEEYPYGLT